MIVWLHDGKGEPGEFLFEGRDRKECINFIKNVTPKHFSIDDLRVNGLPVCYILNVEKPVETRIMKKLQLVHLEIARAKQSTNKEEFRKAFSAYTQSADCDETYEVDEVYGGCEFTELRCFDEDC